MLLALAAYRLDGAPDLPSIADISINGLISEAERARLLGPMVDAVRNGDLVLPEDVAALLVERHEANMLWCVQLEVRLLELRDQFAAAGGVEHLVLKGPAIAHLDEVDPSMRSFADIDVMVAAPHIDRAVQALERAGATRPWPERRPGFDRRFAKSVTMTGPDRIEVDVHRMLCDGVYGVRVPVDDLFADAEGFALAGEDVPTLSRTHRMLHSAYHAVLGSPAPRLSSLRDLARYFASPDLSPSVVAPVAERWRGTAVLATAVNLTTSQLDFDSLEWESWVASVSVAPREFERVERHRIEGSSFGRAKVDMWRELPNTSRRLQYLTAVALPSLEHRRARGMRRTDAARALLRAAGSPNSRRRTG